MFANFEQGAQQPPPPPQQQQQPQPQAEVRGRPSKMDAWNIAGQRLNEPVVPEHVVSAKPGGLEPKVMIGHNVPIQILSK